MKNTIVFWATVLLAVASGASQTKSSAIGQDLDGWITRTEKQLVLAAEEMPEEKYSFAPTAGEFRGVRNFARQVKHVAAANFLFAAGILGEEPPADAADERGPESARTKADIVKYLKDSFASLHRAAAVISTENAVERIKSPFGERTRLSLTVGAIAHCYDHYGQIVEYLRMNGLIPPSSP